MDAIYLSKSTALFCITASVPCRHSARSDRTSAVYRAIFCKMLSFESAARYRISSARLRTSALSICRRISLFNSVKRRIRSSMTGTASSAAADGVGARRSAARSASVKSVSCPTALITGICESNIASTTRSSLNAYRSSADPPPLPTMITSASVLAFR